MEMAKKKTKRPGRKWNSRDHGLYFAWTTPERIAVFELKGGRELGRVDFTRAQVVKLAAFGLGLDVVPRTGPDKVSVRKK